MKTYEIKKFSEPLIERHDDLPVPMHKQVLLRMMACGVCHTDVHTWQGYYEMGHGQRFYISERGLTPPLVAGHEILGEVVAVGPDVTHVRPGDKRLIYPWIGCGNCHYCRSERNLSCGNPQFIGLMKPGGFAEYVLTPTDECLIDASGIDDLIAATLPCSGLTAYSALMKTSHLQRDDILLIVGMGGVGLTAAALAQHLVQATIVVCDIAEDRLEAAKELGITHVINLSQEGAHEKLKVLVQDRLMAAVDFVSSEGTTKLCFDTLAKGGKLIIAGMFGGSWETAIPSWVFRNLTVQASYIGTYHELKELVELVKRKPLGLPVVSRKLSEVTEVLTDLQAGRVLGRAVLVPNQASSLVTDSSFSARKFP